MVYPLTPRFLLIILLFFSVIHDSVITTLELNSDLSRIKQWAFQWKMSFNPDPNKPAQEVIFSRKLKKFCHLSLRFNNNNVSQASSQKHLGLTLDNRLTFDNHLTNVSNKISKTIGLLRKLQNILPRPALLTIYKCFIRPHLDYEDIIYDQAYNLSFHQKLESIQYNAALALTGAIRGSSREKLCQELGLESLQLRRWYRKLCCFYKIYKIKFIKIYKSDSVLTRILLYGNESFKDEVNLQILNATIDFVLSTNRFDEPLYLL